MFGDEVDEAHVVTRPFRTCESDFLIQKIFQCVNLTCQVIKPDDFRLMAGACRFANGKTNSKKLYCNEVFQRIIFRRLRLATAVLNERLGLRNC